MRVLIILVAFGLTSCARKAPPPSFGCVPFGNAPPSIQAFPKANANASIAEFMETQARFFKDPKKWTFHLELTYKTPELNAFSYPQNTGKYGLIDFGPKLLEFVYSLGAGLHSESNRADQAGLATINFVVAHEFAHQIQFQLLQPMFKCYLKPDGSPITKVDFELEADAIAAAWLKAEQGISDEDDEMRVMIYVFRKISNSDFTNPLFHGHSSDRSWAVEAGREAVPTKFSRLTTNILAGIHDTICVHPANRGVAYDSTAKTLLIELAQKVQENLSTADIDPLAAGPSVTTALSRLVKFDDRLRRLAGPNGENDDQLAEATYHALKARNQWKETLLSGLALTNSEKFSARVLDLQYSIRLTREKILTITPPRLELGPLRQKESQS